jgi:hypothetical protein
MPRSFNVSQIWFACEAMTPLKRLILGELLRQFLSPIDGDLCGPLRFSALNFHSTQRPRRYTESRKEIQSGLQLEA